MYRVIVMCNGRFWTQEDLQYLSDNAGYMNHEQLSKRLGRTIRAIKLKQCREGIRFIDNIYSCSLLSRELGKSRRRIMVWCQRGWLKTQRASWTSVYGKKPLIFKEEDIVLFLRNHHELFNPQMMANKYFANVVSDSRTNFLNIC